MSEIGMSHAGVIVQSGNDNKNYRGIVMKNGLTALLIQDLNTVKSAVSLSVAVGKYLNIPLKFKLIIGNISYSLM